MFRGQTANFPLVITWGNKLLQAQMVECIDLAWRSYAVSYRIFLGAPCPAP